MKSLYRIIVGLIMVLPAPAFAGLLGDAVDMSVSGVADQNGVIVDGTIEGSFNFGSDESIDIDVDDFSITIFVTDFTGFWQWIQDPVTVTISDLDVGFPFDIVTSEITNEIGPIVWSHGAGFVSVTFTGSVDVSSSSSSTILEIRADLVPSKVPEPASLALFGFGLLGLGAMRRRRKTA